MLFSYRHATCLTLGILLNFLLTSNAPAQGISLRAIKAADNDPMAEVRAMEKVQFVMNGGEVIKGE